MIFKLFLLAALNGFFFFSLSNSQACNSLGFICDTCTTLQLCTAGVPTSAVLTCATDTYCDSTSSSYCSSTVCSVDPPDYYNCTTTGRFAVTTNCSRYIFCSNNTLGVLYPQLFECPNGTVFNPTTATCVLDSAYDCSGNSTATTTSDNACTAAGRFANATDTTCQDYYLCIYNSNNSTYTLTSLTCPTTTVFNNSTSKCVDPTTYTCSN